MSTLKKIFTSKTFYIGSASIIVLGALILFLADMIIMPAYTNYDEGLTVPDVSQISLEEAQQQLESYGLRSEVAERRSNTAYPADYVIDQTPAPSEIVKPNRKIYLTVNTESNPTVTVPDVVNLSYRNAKLQLQNYGLGIGTVSYESNRFKNRVLRQSIEPEKVVPKGTLVDLAVSDGLGEKTVDVPNILGLRLSEAQQKLQKAGLRVGEIQFKPSKDVDPNVILDYQPKKEQVVVDTTLKLIVSERYNLKEESESGAIIDTTQNIAVPDTTKQ
ncbi:PASTA domain-containing protein [Aliifodinibius halophilus]|uniref:PASTA domain-containing protein n=2 Tax=Fodinibius halophilus TaxID=1736908 RepID=A0A6M1T399_9BACT|nr:PASTA domain-containing protein [Fodinibius halophilus]